MKKTLLRNKNYMLVVLGNFISLMGSNIQQFVLSLYVLELTGSATLFASMLAISILPRILLSPIAGVFGDWFDKKKSIVILDLVNATILALFVVYLFIYDDLSIGLIYALVIVLEITEIFFGSSMSVVLPSVVDKEDYLEANSFRTMVVSIGQIMAPIFGALIYGYLGLMVAIFINAISFLLSGISEMFIKVPKTKSEENEKSISGFKKDLNEGIKIIKDSRPIKTILSTALVINFSISPFFSVGLIFMVKQVLQQSDLRLGILQTFLFASMIISPLLLTKKLKTMKLGDVLVYTFLGIGFLIALTSLSVFDIVISVNKGNLSYLIILIACFIVGILVTAVNIAVSTLIQKIVPLEYMGRTSTVIGLGTAIAIPIGQMLFGFLFDNVNTGFVIILNSVIIISVVIFGYKRMHSIEDDYQNDLTKKVESEVIFNEV
jgi:MFS family permease